MPASIEFPLLQKDTPFGPVSDPKIPVGLPTAMGLEEFRFLIDTGADFSVAPRRLAALAGLDWDALPNARITGIGSDSVSVRIGRLPIAIGGRRLAVRCFFSDGPRSPLLLGRADFLDTFVLTIDQSRRRILLDEVDR